jgi:hypothetical protein
MSQNNNEQDEQDCTVVESESMMRVFDLNDGASVPPLLNVTDDSDQRLLLQQQRDEIRLLDNFDTIIIILY